MKDDASFTFRVAGREKYNEAVFKLLSEPEFSVASRLELTNWLKCLINDYMLCELDFLPIENAATFKLTNQQHSSEEWNDLKLYKLSGRTKGLPLTIIPDIELHSELRHEFELAFEHRWLEWIEEINESNDDIIQVFNFTKPQDALRKIRQRYTLLYRFFKGGYQ